MNAQQLKNSILQMAVSGKLVPQDPSDEPASILLERIRKEKEKLIKEGKIKKEKNPSYIFRGADNTPYEKVGNAEPVSIADEVPFEIPESWEWVRLQTVCTKLVDGDHNPPKGEVNRTDYIMASSTNINQDRLVDLEKVRYLSAETFFKENERTSASAGDIFFTSVGSLGRSCIFDGSLNICFQRSVSVLTTLLYNEYLKYCFDSGYFQNKVQKEATGTAQKGFYLNQLASALIPVPPYQEQVRIVSEIKKYLPLISEYETKQASLNELNDNFPDQLKKSILQLAVQGKLVPQEPSDEPASVLLKRIRAEKERLIKEGKIKRDKNESVIIRRDNSHYEKRGKTETCIDEEIPFDVPESWQWVRLSSICSLITDGEHKTPRRVSSFQGYYLLSARNIRDGSLALDDVDYVDATEYENISRRCNPQKNDVLISCSGSIGRVCRVEDDNNYVMVRSAAMVSPILVNSEFLMYSLQSGIVQAQIKEKTKQTAQANLFQAAIRDLFLPVPPAEEQKRICEAIVPLLKLCKFSL